MNKDEDVEAHKALSWQWRAMDDAGRYNREMGHGIALHEACEMKIGVASPVGKVNGNRARIT